MARIRIEPLQRPDEVALSGPESGRVVGAGPYYSSFYPSYGAYVPYGYGGALTYGGFASVTTGLGGGIGLNNPMQSVASPFGFISGPTAYRLGY